jgi:hypothetical protein
VQLEDCLASNRHSPNKMPSKTWCGISQQYRQMRRKFTSFYNCPVICQLFDSTMFATIYARGIIQKRQSGEEIFYGCDTVSILVTKVLQAVRPSRFVRLIRGNFTSVPSPAPLSTFGRRGGAHVQLKAQDSAYGAPNDNAVLFQFPTSGKLSLTKIGFSKVLGVAFDSAHRAYVLEMSKSDNGFPAPFTGDVVRINSDGSVTTIDSGLMFPPAMTFGPDGKLYVSNFGFGGGPGAGQVVRITVP